MRLCSLPAAELRSKHPFDEVLAQGQVVEPPFFLHGQEGKALHHFAGEHACTFSLRHSMLIIYFHAE
jgi:hypothetical protein